MKTESLEANTFRKKFLRLRLILKLLRLGRNPESTDLVFDIAYGLYELGAFAEVENRLSLQAANNAVVKNRTLLGPIEFKKLEALPEGTLGRSYFVHMTGLGLDPNFYRVRKIDNDSTFVLMRLRQTHDLWHLATGFKTDVPGELGLQAFMLSYLRLPLPGILIGGSLLRITLTQPKMLDPVVREISRGLMLGNQVGPLFAFDWQGNWNLPLADIRRELGLLT